MIVKKTSNQYPSIRSLAKKKEKKKKNKKTKKQKKKQKHINKVNYGPGYLINHSNAEIKEKSLLVLLMWQ